MKSELKILNKVAGITRLTVMDTLLLLPTIISESAPCSFAPIKFIVRPVALMATRFGDLFDRMQKHCAFLQMLLHLRKAVFMAAVRGRPSGLPVFRSRFANLRTAVTHSFGDE